MTRVPISFYLNVLAGILVVFNHYASSETGDVALNKVTGAAGRFYDLFRDSTRALYDSYTMWMETTVCGSVVEGLFPRDVRAHFCHVPPVPEDSKNDWR